MKEGDRVGAVRVQKQALEGNDPYGGHERVWEGDGRVSRCAMEW